MDNKYERTRIIMGFGNKFSDVFSNEFWRKAEKLHTDNISGKYPLSLRWPQKCYVPEQVWLAFLVKEDVPIEIIDEVKYYFSTLAAWSSSLLTYRIDSKAFNFAYKNQFPDILPASQIVNFINGACLFEMIDFNNVNGFFISLDYNMDDKLYILKVLLEKDNKRIPLVVELGNWSLDEGIRKGLSREFDIQGNEMDSTVEYVISWVEPILKLILCFENNKLIISEIDNCKTRDFMRITKQSMGIKEYSVSCNK